MLPLLLLAPLFLHFFVICRLCSHEGSLLAFKLSLRVIWFWDEHSLHAPFSYRHAAGKMGTHYYMPNFVARLPLGKFICLMKWFTVSCKSSRLLPLHTQVGFKVLMLHYL